MNFSTIQLQITSYYVDFLIIYFINCLLPSLYNTFQNNFISVTCDIKFARCTHFFAFISRVWKVEFLYFR